VRKQPEEAVMSDTQSYKTVTFSPKQAENMRLALLERQVSLEQAIAAYEAAGWVESAEKAQADLDIVHFLFRELSV
jgi:hypothetical protein